jgi:hypothetical protein
VALAIGGGKGDCKEYFERGGRKSSGVVFKNGIGRIVRVKDMLYVYSSVCRVG